MQQQSLIEALEDRTLMTLTVASMRSDNRGESILTLSDHAKASTVTSASVMMFTGGADKVLGTPDDVKVTASVKYTDSNKRITVRAKAGLPANTGYMVKLFSSRLLDTSNQRLDGEFNGTFPAGNGVPGGDFRAQTKNDKTVSPQVRFSTSDGVIDVQLFRGVSPLNATATPLNVAHFLKLADAGDYDNIFIHRVAKDFVVQFGGLNLNAQGNPGAVPSIGSVNGEPGNSNKRGTISFALSTGPNSADNEFFFNTVNNDGSGATPNLDDNSNGGPFTAFGKIISGLPTLDAINNLHRVDFSGAIGSLGSSADNVPVHANVVVTGETQNTGGSTTSNINPFTDLVVIRRVAERMKIARVA